MTQWVLGTKEDLLNSADFELPNCDHSHWQWIVQLISLKRTLACLISIGLTAGLLETGNLIL